MNAIVRNRFDLDDQAVQHSKWAGPKGTFAFFTGLIALTFLLRIPYAGYLFQDDGLWFTAAEELLSGKSLYREVYLDKPPFIAMVYAWLFWLFGTHIIVIRLFMILYSVVISSVLYRFGTRLYSQRVGVLAAVMFAFFSTTSVNNHVQGLNTDFLMLLPYVTGAYLFVRSYFEGRVWLSLLGGILVGVAVQTNPKAIFALAFLPYFCFSSPGGFPDQTVSISPALNR